MEQKRPIPTERLSSIRQEMVEHFTLGELRDLCFELGINWEQLSGDTLDGKTTSLLERLNRQARLPLLLAQLHILRPSVAWALDDLAEVAAPPYKGLAVYDRQDAGLFFGRERVIGELVALAGRRSFVAVVGKSGSGKSSIVRAGVVPALRGDRPPPEGATLPRECRRWVYLEMTPTARPVEQLAIVLTRDLTAAAATQTALAELGHDPATAAIHLRKYLERQSAPRAFLLVDQFEELHTICKDENARAAFIAGLLAIAESGRATVFITLRADFLHHFIDSPPLWPTLDENKFVIRAMNEDELREAVEQPALTTGYELEPGLSDVIVRDVGQDAATLPLLSHALLETWRRREGWRLTHAGYNAAGGVGGAIAKTAERTYGDLDPEQQKSARRIFLELTELGEGAEDTRRSVPLADLLPDDPANRAAAEVVLDALYRARLVTADAEAAQVTHEAIIREWPALREWLRDEREALRLERRLEAAAAEWHAGQRDASYLYGGAQLAAACQWAGDNSDNLAPIVRDFLEAATAEEKREAAEREAEQQAKLAQAQRLAEEASAREQAQARAARTFRRAAAIVGVLGLAALGLALLAFIQRDNATARLLLNQSERVFESDPLLANRLLLEAIDVAGSEAASREAAFALADNLRTGRTTIPITGTSVLDFHGVHTNTLYVVDYQLGKDSLISGVTGESVAVLSGDIAQVLTLPDSTFFLIDYFNVPDELRRTDDVGWVIDLNDRNLNNVVTAVDSPFFVVNHSGAPSELRRTDDAEWVIQLNGGDVAAVLPIPDTPIVVIDYLEDQGELRWTNDERRSMTLTREVTRVVPIPDSPYFVVHYRSAAPELRRTDDEGRVVSFNGNAYYVLLIHDGPFFVVSYYDEPGELRRTDIDGWVTPLRGGVRRLTSLPDSPYFVVHYSDKPGEVLQTDDVKSAITLNGRIRDVVSNPDSTFFIIDYDEESDELRWIDQPELAVTLTGELSDSVLSGYLNPALFINKPFFVISYENAPSELRRMDDLDWFASLSGIVSRVDQLPDSPVFVVNYNAMPGELRRTDDLGWVVSLSGEVIGVDSLPDSPIFAISYAGATGELRRTDDLDWVVPLRGNINSIDPLPNSPFFAIDFTNTLDELRWKSIGTVITNKGGQRMANDADVLSADQELYWIRYQDGTSDVFYSERAIVNLEQGAKQSLYFPETNRVAVRYGDGRVVYIDLNLIEALGGADAEATLAAMSPEDLVARTCDILFIDNPEWDEAKLDEYLAFLPEGRARACGE